jgi:hypothetical protein
LLKLPFGHKLLALFFAAAIFLVCRSSWADFNLRMRQPQTVHQVKPALMPRLAELMWSDRRNDIILIQRVLATIKLPVAELSASRSIMNISLSGDMPQSAAWKRIVIAGSLIPIAFMWQTLLHEGSHALMATASGSSITEFKPYPHIVNRKLYFGRTETDGTMGKGTYTIFLLTPYIMDVLVFSATDMLLSYGAVKQKGNAESILYLFGMLAPLVDFAFGFVAGSD